LDILSDVKQKKFRGRLGIKARKWAESILDAGKKISGAGRKSVEGKRKIVGRAGEGGGQGKGKRRKGAIGGRGDKVTVTTSGRSKVKGGRTTAGGNRVVRCERINLKAIDGDTNAKLQALKSPRSRGGGGGRGKGGGGAKDCNGLWRYMESR